MRGGKKTRHSSHRRREQNVSKGVLPDLTIKGGTKRISIVNEDLSEVIY